jgi:hypothetical protein
MKRRTPSDRVLRAAARFWASGGRIGKKPSTLPGLDDWIWHGWDIGRDYGVGRITWQQCADRTASAALSDSCAPRGMR